MKVPKCNAMDAYRALLLKEGELEAILNITKEQIKSIPKQMRTELGTEQERVEAAHYLYWFTDIPVPDIAAGLLGLKMGGSHTNTFLQRIGSITIDITCDRCHKPMECRSRQRMRDILHDVNRGPKYYEGYHVLCDPCWKGLQVERYEIHLREKAQEGGDRNRDD